MGSLGPSLRKPPINFNSFGKKSGGRARFNTEFFFDRALIENKIGKHSARALRRLGGLVRSTARNSMKYSSYKSGKKSAPGSPPNYHVRGSNFNLKKIQYYFDPMRKTTIVGPIGKSSTGPSVPEIMEKGGMVRKRNRYRKGSRLTTMVRVAPRPYMKPALDITKQRYPKHWKDALK